MPLTNELKASYEAVMLDLEAERQQIQVQLAPLQARLKELHHSILTLGTRLNPDANLRAVSAPKPNPVNRKYVHISARWAILDLLTDSEPMTTAEIAEALKVNGIQTRAANFTNNVSSVLTTTMKSEVRLLDGGKWELSEIGKSAIAHIRTTMKFKRGIAVAA